MKKKTDMKKKILLVLSIVAMLCIFALSVCAEEVDGVHYTLDEKNQTATVNKTNRTAQTEIANIPSYITYEGVEYKVNKIENDAFAGNKTVVEIRILSKYITAIPLTVHWKKSILIFPTSQAMQALLLTLRIKQTAMTQRQINFTTMMRNHFWKQVRT